MIATTIVLLVLLATLLPLRLSVAVAFVPQKLQADVVVRLYGVKVFDEKVVVRQGMLVFSGSVSQCIRLVDVNLSGGNELAKAVCVRQVYLLSKVNMCASPTAICAVSLLTIFIGQIAAFVHSDVGSIYAPTTEETKICLAAELSTSLCEIGICLVNQSVSSVKQH